MSISGNGSITTIRIFTTPSQVPSKNFLTHDADARPGRGFVRIGVGVVRKPDEPAYQRFKTYEIINPGRRCIRKGRDWIEFTQELQSSAGYEYIYKIGERSAAAAAIERVKKALGAMMKTQPLQEF